MSKQRKHIFNKNNLKEKREYEILNLEQKYFDLLANVFGRKDFKNSLLETEKWTNHHYLSLHKWKKKNKVELACQRLVFYNVFKYLDEEIIDTYNSSISSDIAFVTKDAIINIDSKTVNIIKNNLDWKRLFLAPNQASFQNINWGSRENKETSFPGFNAELNIFPFDNLLNKPVLTFFIAFLYSDNGKDEFSWYRGGYKNDMIYDSNMKLTLVPNGLLSEHFDKDLVVGVKKYSSNPTNDVDVKRFKDIPNRDKLEKIIVESKEGYFDPQKKIVWLKTWRGKTKKNRREVFANTTGIDIVRMDYDTLRVRFNGDGKQWDAFKTWKI